MSDKKKEIKVGIDPVTGFELMLVMWVLFWWGEPDMADAVKRLAYPTYNHETNEVIEHE